jgi:3-oxoacyl-[acyl-carrier-protein] synthase-1
MRPLAITGVGVVSPVGLSAAATAAALRAGVTTLGAIASSEVDDDGGTSGPAVGGRVPLEWFEGGPKLEDWSGHKRVGAQVPMADHLYVEDGADRLVRLAVPAAVEAWRRTGAPEGSAPSDAWGLYLGLDDADEGQEVVAEIARAFGAAKPWRPERIEAVRRGRGATLEALHRAAQDIEAGRVTGALVGGVDSLVRPSVYERLAGEGRLRDPEDNPQGILPGEAAAFVALDAQARAGSVLAHLVGTGIADEPTVGTDKPNIGTGLTAAIAAARAGVPLDTYPVAICDLNGDRYRATEWALVASRTLGDLGWPARLPLAGMVWAAAQCTGDTGAASGALNIAWSIESLKKGYAVLASALVWGASDGPLRAAAIITTT